MARTRKNRGFKGIKERFPGLLSSLFLLMLTGLVLAVSLIIPPPPSVGVNARPVYENFMNVVPGAPVTGSDIKTCSLDNGLPMLAIVIDDMGYDIRLDRAFLDIDASISFAFLPFAPHTETLAMLAAERGRDILVHMPMEPDKKRINPGPGALMLSMDRKTTVELARKNIDAVPGAAGVNNHMGSAYTVDARHMSWLLEELEARGMFFLDSRTTSRTIAWKTAFEMGVPATWRDVFLDHRPDYKAIKSELSRAVKIALKNGSAVAIGHPHRQTLRVLYHELPLIRKYVRIVPVHMLLCRAKK